MKKYLKSFLIIGAILLLFANFTWSATPLSDERVKEAGQCGINVVDVNAAKELIKKGAVIVDVRESPEQQDTFQVQYGLQED